MTTADVRTMPCQSTTGKAFAFVGPVMASRWEVSSSWLSDKRLAAHAWKTAISNNNAQRGLYMIAAVMSCSPRQRSTQDDSADQDWNLPLCCLTLRLTAGESAGVGQSAGANCHAEDDQ